MAIVNTKLFAPRASVSAVERPALEAELHRGLNLPVTLVCAPAGFGKSQLLSTWAQSGASQFGWLQLEASDSDPIRLLHYLTAALRRAQPASMTTTWGLLESAQSGSQDAIALSFLNDACDLQSDTALVLDDFHTLDAPSCDALIAQLIDYAPPQLHWYIASREDPSLPLAKWRAGGHLVEVRANDLMFSEAEAEVFFRQSMGLALPSEASQALCRRTEGWIAALQLAGLSLKNKSDIQSQVAAFTGSNRFVTDYLMTEVLANLPSSTKAFIASTVYLPRFTVELCSAVLGHEVPHQLLQELEQNNGFVIALDDQRCWYRYHHLFADVVANQHSQLGLDKNTVLERAARWFHQNQLPIEAITTALNCQHPTLLADLIELNWPQLRSHHSEADFLLWMQQLPQNEIEQRPVLAAFYGLALLSENFPLGQQYLAVADAGTVNAVIVNPTAHQSVAGIVAIGQAYISGAQGDFMATIEHTEAAIACLPQQDHVWQGAARAMRGIQYWCTGQLVDAVATLRQACKHMLASDDASAQISTRFLLASCLRTQGRLNEATQEVSTGLAQLQMLNGVFPQGSVDLMVLRAECHIESNELDKARQLLEHAENLGPAAQLAESRHRLPIARASLALAQGNYSAAMAELNLAENIKSHSPVIEFTPIPALKALFALAQGKLTDAEDWAEAQLAAVDSLSPQDTTQESASNQWVVAVYCLRVAGATSSGQNNQHYLATAESLLAALTPWSEQLGSHEFSIDIALANAELAWLQQRKKAALQQLERALFLAQEYGYLRALLSSPVVVKLWPDINTGQLQPIHNKLSALLFSPAAGAPTLAEPLSDRELDVLRQLDSALTGPEIADTLFISLNTFRTHSKNIYSKLGVNSRRSAVARAHALQLINS